MNKPVVGMVCSPEVYNQIKLLPEAKKVNNLLTSIGGVPIYIDPCMNSGTIDVYSNQAVLRYRLLLIEAAAKDTIVEETE